MTDPPPLDPRDALRDRLRSQGYTEQQIHAFMNPAGLLPPSQQAAEWRRLHAMGYSPQQIQALITPLPKLPSAQKRNYTELIVWLIVIAVVAICMGVAVFSAVSDQAVPGH